jgi:hypothetical protein
LVVFEVLQKPGFLKKPGFTESAPPFGSAIKEAGNLNSLLLWYADFELADRPFDRTLPNINGLRSHLFQQTANSEKLSSINCQLSKTCALNYQLSNDFRFWIGRSEAEGLKIEDFRC